LGRRQEAQEAGAVGRSRGAGTKHRQSTVTNPKSQIPDLRSQISDYLRSQIQNNPKSKIANPKSKI
jgi:hypothetical protein